MPFNKWLVSSKEQIPYDRDDDSASIRPTDLRQANESIGLEEGYE
jgi:hypothetical protein